MDDEKWRDPHDRIKIGKTWRPSDDNEIQSGAEQDPGIAATAPNPFDFFIKKLRRPCTGVFL